MGYPRLVRFDICSTIFEFRLQYPGEPCMGCTLSFFSVFVDSLQWWDVNYDPSGSHSFVCLGS